MPVCALDLLATVSVGCAAFAEDRKRGRDRGGRGEKGQEAGQREREREEGEDSER